MLIHQTWLSFFLFIASVSANVPPVPGQSVYYNSTRLSASLVGPTYTPSGTGQGTVFRRGFTERSASSATIFSPSRTKFTNSVPASPTGKQSRSTGSVKPSYFPTISGASTAVTGKPTYATSTTIRTLLSTGYTYAKRALPSLAPTEILHSSVKPTRLSTGYTYSKSSTGTMSTSATIALPNTSSVNRSRLSTGYTFPVSSRSPSGSGSSRLTTATPLPSTGPTSRSSSLPASTGTLPFSTSRNVTSSPTRTAPSSRSPSTMPSTFKLQVFVITNDATSPKIDGSYISLQPDEKGQDALRIVSDTSEASIFTLTTDGYLESGNEFAGISAGKSYGNLLVHMESASNGGFVKSVCHNSGGVLTCATGSNVAFFTCDSALGTFVEVGPAGGRDDTGCVEFLLLVVWGR